MSDYLLKEDGDFLLQENNDKVILEEGVASAEKSLTSMAAKLEAAGII